MIEKEVPVERLSSFPLNWLDNPRKTKPFVINNNVLKQICNDILPGRENSIL